MAINTTNITGDIFLPTGAVREKSYVIFEMTGIDTDDDSDAVIVPFPIRAPIDDAGSIDVDLWPNSDGVRSTFYNVTIEVYNGTRAHMVGAGKIAVPAVWGSYDLNDLLPVSPPSGASVDDYIAYLEQAVADANAAADEAAINAGNLKTYTETDAEMASVLVPATATVIFRYPTATGSVTVGGEWSAWARHVGATMRPYFTTSGGDIWVQVNLDISQVTSILRVL